MSEREPGSIAVPNVPSWDYVEGWLRALADYAGPELADASRRAIEAMVEARKVAPRFPPQAIYRSDGCTCIDWSEPALVEFRFGARHGHAFVYRYSSGWFWDSVHTSIESGIDRLRQVFRDAARAEAP